MNWLENIAIEDLPEIYQEMACVIGLEQTLKVAAHFGGGQGYFPKLEALIARQKAAYIIANFNGSNHRDLSKATDVSERWVYEVLKCHREQRQCSLFTTE